MTTMQTITLYAIWKVGVNGPLSVEGNKAAQEATAQAFNERYSDEGRWYVTEYQMSVPVVEGLPQEPQMDDRCPYL